MPKSRFEPEGIPPQNLQYTPAAKWLRTYGRRQHQGRLLYDQSEGSQRVQQLLDKLKLGRKDKENALTAHVLPSPG
ncbi:hypothetical protein WJX72_004711 [[Myrmecia] bisecta]|uniref:Uncharacterized protein n=1 Tax=[Myrmecia] bisecta TaxID=41462 RepID=A0AAW1P7I6_9CHLO